MNLSKAMMFVDGENLTLRYQAMLADGSYEPLDETHYIPDYFVWHPNIAPISLLEFTRVSYYTSIVGDDTTLSEARAKIAKATYSRRTPNGFANYQIVPFVFKKLAQSQKTKSVDINIAIDVMRHAHSNEIDVIFIVSGDGDFLPLARETMRLGKQVIIGALTSGLNSELVFTADRFVELDRLLLRPKSQPAA